MPEDAHLIPPSNAGKHDLVASILPAEGIQFLVTFEMRTQYIFKKKYCKVLQSRIHYLWMPTNLMNKLLHLLGLE